jgi:hypothetical protein
MQSPLSGVLRAHGSLANDTTSVAGTIAALAQPVEHIIRNDGVACSSHASGTNIFKGLD